MMSSPSFLRFTSIDGKSLIVQTSQFVGAMENEIGTRIILTALDSAYQSTRSLVIEVKESIDTVNRMIVKSGFHVESKHGNIDQK